MVSKVKHHLKNDAITVKDMDIPLLNADKNNRIIKTSHKTKKNQIIF